MKCEEGGNCNVKISAQVKRGPVHLHKLMRTKEIYSDKVWDCAGKKSIFSANHILIIAYGQIALLLASINLICQVWSSGGQISFGPCATVYQRIFFFS